jgi:hypothetical protein
MVAVSDGRGGLTTGLLTVPVGKPKLITPPIITAKVQSARVVDAGDSVNFSVEASAPQDSALTFLWVSSAGALSNQVDAPGTSQVVWTAPATANATYTVSVIVSNANGASVQTDFAVDVGPASSPDGGVCACTGAGPGGVPVTVACGQSTCGSDNVIYACSASGFTSTGQTCAPCQCSGAGPGGVPVTVACGQSTCGSDNVIYACSAAGWSATGISCP